MYRYRYTQKKYIKCDFNKLYVINMTLTSIKPVNVDNHIIVIQSFYNAHNLHTF